MRLVHALLIVGVTLALLQVPPYGMDEVVLARFIEANGASLPSSAFSAAFIAFVAVELLGLVLGVPWARRAGAAAVLAAFGSVAYVIPAEMVVSNGAPLVTAPGMAFLGVSGALGGAGAMMFHGLGAWSRTWAAIAGPLLVGLGALVRIVLPAFSTFRVYVVERGEMSVVGFLCRLVGALGPALVVAAWCTWREAPASRTVDGVPFDRLNLTLLAMLLAGVGPSVAYAAWLVAFVRVPCLGPLGQSFAAWMPLSAQGMGLVAAIAFTIAVRAWLPTTRSEAG